jgi:hypothetical protein
VVRARGFGPALSFVLVVALCRERSKKSQAEKEQPLGRRPTPLAAPLPWYGSIESIEKKTEVPNG